MKSDMHKENIVPKNIMGIKGTFIFFTFFFFAATFIVKKTKSPITEAANPEKIQTGNPDINPQKIL